MSKKEQRTEAKKRKAIAFLKLVNDKEKANTDSGCTAEKRVKPENETKAKTEDDIADTPENGTQTETKNEFDVKSEHDPGGSSEALAKKIREEVRTYRKAAMERPKVFLTLDYITDDDGQPPLFIVDLQHLVLYGLEGNITSYKPRWCKLLRVAKVTSVVVVVFDGVGQVDYNKYKPSFPHLDTLFDMSIALTAPSEYGNTVDKEMFSVPLSVSTLLREQIPLKEAKEIAFVGTPGNVHHLNLSRRQRDNFNKEDAFPRTHLLLSTGQMSAEKYPLPVESQNERCKDFEFTCEKYKEVTPDSPLFAVDCEMCKTAEKEPELTWVSVVNEDLEVIYESLVKPHNKIENYLTRFSGITKDMLKTVNTRLSDVQRNIKYILPPNAILCGQSLNSDLKALKMFHPYVIDTSIIYNLSGYHNVKPSLRKLANLFLGKLIQDEVSGHNPSEDAIATMELVKLKLKQGLAYGDVRMGRVIYPKFPAEQSNQQNTPAQDTGVSHKTETVKSEGKCDSNNSRSVNSDNSDNSQSINKDTVQCDRTISQANSAHQGDHSASTRDQPEVKGGEPASEGDQTTPATSETNRENSISSIKDMVERRKHFFRNKGYSVDCSFFDKLKKASKKGTLVDRPEVLDRYRDVDLLECLDTTSDKETKSQAKTAVESKDFVWAQFHNYQEQMNDPTDVTDEDREHCLKKMDRRMSKIFRKAPQSSLCVIVLTGRTDNHTANSAMAFVRIKN